MLICTLSSSLPPWKFGLWAHDASTRVVGGCWQNLSNMSRPKLLFYIWRLFHCVCSLVGADTCHSDLYAMSTLSWPSICLLPQASLFLFSTLSPFRPLNSWSGQSLLLVSLYTFKHRYNCPPTKADDQLHHLKTQSVEQLSSPLSLNLSAPNEAAVQLSANFVFCPHIKPSTHQPSSGFVLILQPYIAAEYGCHTGTPTVGKMGVWPSCSCRLLCSLVIPVFSLGCITSVLRWIAAGPAQFLMWNLVTLIWLPIWNSPLSWCLYPTLSWVFFGLLVCFSLAHLLSLVSLHTL